MYVCDTTGQEDRHLIDVCVCERLMRKVRMHRVPHTKRMCCALRV